MIDPRKMLDIDDLPQWLQAVAQRETGHSTPASQDSLPSDEPGPETIKPLLTGKAPPMTHPDQPARPHDVVESTTASTTSTAKSGNANHPWWMSDGVVGGLFVAIILTMLYVVLVATGVL